MINSMQQGPSHQIPMQATPNSHTELNTLAFLAHALEPYAVQGPSPHTPGSVPPARVAEALYNIPTGATAASVSSNPVRQSVDDGQQGGSHGTLMLGKRGRSKYLGPTAGSEWLKEAGHLASWKNVSLADPYQSEMQDAPDTPLMTRAPSPEPVQDSAPAQPRLSSSHFAPVGFPLIASPAHISTRELLASLPPREEAWTLVESYYRYCAWQ